MYLRDVQCSITVQLASLRAFLTAWHLHHLTLQTHLQTVGQMTVLSSRSAIAFKERRCREDCQGSAYGHSLLPLDSRYEMDTFRCVFSHSLIDFMSHPTGTLVLKPCCSRAQGLCKSLGGRPGLAVPSSPAGLRGRKVT